MIDELFIRIKDKVKASNDTSKTLINIGELLHQYRSQPDVIKYEKPLHQLDSDELAILGEVKGFSFNITDISNSIRVLRFIKVKTESIDIVSFSLCMVTHIIEDCCYNEFKILDNQLTKDKL